MKPEESSALSSESSSCCTPVLDSNKNYNNENVFDKHTDIGQYNDNKIVSSDHENFSPSPNNTFPLNSETNNNNSLSDFSIKNEVNENLNLINNKTQNNLELESISNSKSFLPEPGFTDVKKVFGESLSESFLDSNKTIKNDTLKCTDYDKSVDTCNEMINAEKLSNNLTRSTSMKTHQLADINPVDVSNNINEPLQIELINYAQTIKILVDEKNDVENELSEMQKVLKEKSG